MVLDMERSQPNGETAVIIMVCDGRFIYFLQQDFKEGPGMRIGLVRDALTTGKSGK